MQGGAWKEQARRQELNVAYFNIMLTKNNNNLLPLRLYQILPEGVYLLQSPLVSTTKKVFTQAHTAVLTLYPQSTVLYHQGQFS